MMTFELRGRPPMIDPAAALIWCQLVKRLPAIHTADLLTSIPDTQSLTSRINQLNEHNRC